MVIFVFSLLFTSLVSFFAVAIIPDETRPQYLNNLISGLAMNFVGPDYLKLIFQAFVVLVGFLMLSGAVNTSIIGSNGVLNRVSEDGVLTDWFRAPHKKYGTTYRIITLIAVMQIVTIIGSRGNIFISRRSICFWRHLELHVQRAGDSGSALRSARGARVESASQHPRLAATRDPVGLLTVAFILLSTRADEPVHQRGGDDLGHRLHASSFFTYSQISERINRRKLDLTLAPLDQFQLQHSETIDQEAVGARPGNVLVGVRDYNTLSHLEHVLAADEHGRAGHSSDDRLRLVAGPDGGERELYDENLFTEYEQKLIHAGRGPGRKARQAC